MTHVPAPRIIFVLLIFFCAPIFIFAQVGDTALVLPFENHSSAPGLDWIGEAFPEVLNQRLVTPNLFLVNRADRLYAFDRLGIPANVRISRATVYRIAEEMDVDYVLLGWFGYDGATFTAHAQVLNMHTLRLSPELVESSPLPGLIQSITALAWEVQRQITPNLLTSRNAFVSAWPAIRLDAFENYIRGIVASTQPEKAARLKAALRISPVFPAASLELGKMQFEQRDYANASATLARVPITDPVGSEAQFFTGLAAFYSGNFERAENAFRAVAAQVPLAEVSNNIGIAVARRNQRSAAPYFQEAASADPSENDYQFNLGVALLRSGDKPGALRHLKEAFALDSTDTETKALLDAVAAGQTPSRLPMERIKTNYDEASFRQLAWEIRQINEQRLAAADPATRLRFHLDRGEQLFSQGVYREAENEFRDALQQDPNNAQAHLRLALTLEKLSSPIAAIRSEAQAALRVQPSAAAYALLGRLALREKQPDAARDALQRGLKLDPADADLLALQTALAEQ
jgi:Tfp pilus assembly protein PilF/TolB-like protein